MTPLQLWVLTNVANVRSERVTVMGRSFTRFTIGSRDVSSVIKTLYKHKAVRAGSYLRRYIDHKGREWEQWVQTVERTPLGDQVFLEDIFDHLYR